MHIMASQILKYVDFTKAQKSRYLENETFFLQIKKFINYISKVTLWQNCFAAEVTFNKQISENYFVGHKLEENAFLKDMTTLNRAFSNHLLSAVTARSTLFEKWNTFSSNKISKNTCNLGGCSVLNVLNLKKCRVKIHNCALLLHFIDLFWFYRTHALIF